MKRPGILLLNLLIMVGYSVIFMGVGSFIGDSVIALHWPVLLIHIVALFIYGLYALSSETTRKAGSQYLLASLLVGIIGHGLCFFNGLLNMGNIH